MMSWSRIVTLLVLVLAGTGFGQPVDPYYQEDFANDNLYHDYAARQQEKLIGAPNALPWGKLVAATVCGWFIGGKYHAGKVTKKLNTKHKQEQKELYTQYYNDVYTLKEQNLQLIQALEKMGVTVK